MAGPHKYKSRKRVGGRWVYTYEEEPSVKEPGYGQSPEAKAWQERIKKRHAELMERRKAGTVPTKPRPAPGPEPKSKRAARAKITEADRKKYPADVIEEAEAIGERPDEVLKLREMSRREEADYGRKMRRGARAPKAQKKGQLKLFRSMSSAQIVDAQAALAHLRG